MVNNKLQIEDPFFIMVMNDLFDGVYFVNSHKKITFWNNAAELLTGYYKADGLGKCCKDNILYHVSSDGRKLCETNNCPLAKAMHTGEQTEAEVYFHHKAGHRVLIQSKSKPVRNQDGEIIGAIEIFSPKNDHHYSDIVLNKFKELALLDPLTHVGNRRFGEINLQSKLNELKRYDWPFGILFIDIDYFKRVNDMYGHDVGDRVLKMVAHTLVNSLRSFDIICRWGGEEFLILIVNVSEDELYTIADKLLRLVETSGITINDVHISVTVSIGATLAKPDDSSDSLLRPADRLMYLSKSAGRNRVSME